MRTITIGTVTARMDEGVLSLTDAISPEATIQLSGDGPAALGKFLAELTLPPLPSRDTNSRQAFRVPLTELSGLTVRVGGEPCPPAVVPVSISATGLFVAPASTGATLSGPPLDWPIGREVELFLDFEQQSLLIHGVVCRREGGGCGLLFRESFRGEELEPPPQLTRIVLELQRRRLASGAK